MSIKLRAPPDCGAVSHKNEVIVIDHDECVDVEEDIAHILLAHGFTPLSREPDDRDRLSRTRVLDVPVKAGTAMMDEFDDFNRRDLFAFLKAQGVSVSLPVTNRELRVMARNSLKSASESH